MVPVKKITLVPPTSPDAILNRDRRRGDPTASGTGSGNATRSKSVFEPAKAAPTDEPTRVRVHFQSTSDDARGTMARGANGGMVITARGDSKGMGGWVVGGSGGEAALQSLSFCLGCPNPRQEGSMGKRHTHTRHAHSTLLEPSLMSACLVGWLFLQCVVCGLPWAHGTMTSPQVRSTKHGIAQ